jgi:H+-transporting ATPase
MAPLGWGWALFVWGYALAWFLVNDRVKLIAYRIFDPTKAPLLTKKTHAVAALSAKSSLDLTPQIATRAYELYEQRGRGAGHADQDWLEAERETRQEEAGIAHE